MYRPLLLFLLITLIKSESTDNRTICDGFQANFNMKDIIGRWDVVAIIPEKLFPEKDITCYKVEFSETDEASLRWLANKTQESNPKTDVIDIKGTIVRQRYHSDHAFDVWSKSIEGVSGCFQQVLSLDIVKNDKIHKVLTNHAMMQLHIMQSVDNSGPFLLQMLWGRLISVVVYRKTQGITQDQLKPVFELMSKLRGPQRTPKLCDNHIRDLLIF